MRPVPALPTPAATIIIGITAAIGLAFLAGCTVGPDYQRPKTAVPPQWTSPLAQGETNQPANLTNWWHNFNDTNLDAFVASAIQSNLTLQVAAAHVREARAERDVAYGALWPSVGTTAAYSRNRWGENSFPPIPAGVPLDYNLYNAGFDAAWELDVFGGTRRAVEAATAEVGAAEYDQRGVLVSLLAEVARNYIEARGYQQRLIIARQNIQVEADTLDLSSNRFENGLGNDVDVQQSLALLTDTQAKVPALETGLAASLHHLAVLLGQPPGVPLQGFDLNDLTMSNTNKDGHPVAIPMVEGTTGTQPLAPPSVPVGLPSDLLLRRPDVQQAERKLAAATAQIGVAKADLFPKFSLTGMAGLESISASDWFDYGSRYWSAGPTVQWEIFEAGRLRAKVRVQNARQEQALNTYQQTILTALEDAENALTAYAQEQNRHKSLAQSVQADQQAVEMSMQLYKSGLEDFLHVLDSERSLYNAQDALVQSTQSIALDLVQLYKALGGGWETVKVDKKDEVSAAK